MNETSTWRERTPYPTAADPNRVGSPHSQSEPAWIPHPPSAQAEQRSMHGESLACLADALLDLLAQQQAEAEFGSSRLGPPRDEVRRDSPR